MSKRIRVRGIEMAYDVEGSGPPVVLLHGYPFNRSMWSEQIEALQGNHRVIAPDLRGLGETEAGAETAATMNEMAEDVAALLDALGIDRVTLGGLSMGGYVLLAFFRRFPLRARALILADTRPQPDTEEGKRIREEQAQKVLAEGTASITDVILKKALAPATLAERPDALSGKHSRADAYYRRQRRRADAARRCRDDAARNTRLAVGDYSGRG